MATTNFIDRIPLRLQRPGRFSSIVEVGFPSAEARGVFLKHKKIKEDLIQGWVRKTEGFSIDEVKETVLAVTCLDEDLDVVVQRLVELKARGLEAESKSRNSHKEDVMESLVSSMLGRQLPGRFR